MKIQSLSEQSTTWQGLNVVVGLGLLLRLLVATLTERSLHSDEIFQYVEQAHRLTYGYGYIPWEYVHGIRNWLLPGAISLVLSSCRLLGITSPVHYTQVVQFLACGLSISLIYSAYWLGRSLFSESVGRTASILTALWYELVIRAHTLTPEIVGAYLLMAAATYLAIKPSYATAVLLGLCSGAAVALRLQYVPAVAVIVVVTLLFGGCRKWTPQQVITAAVSGLAVVIFVGGLDDYTWGRWFASFTNNYLYNKVYGVSSLWGDDPVGYYALQLGLYSGGVFWVAIAHSLSGNKAKPWLLLSLLAAIVIPHMFIGHKEYRFIFAAVPICLLLSAFAIDSLWQPRKYAGNAGSLTVGAQVAGFKAIASRQNWGQCLLNLTVFYAVVTLLVTSFFIEPKADDLQAYLYLSEQPQVVSVLHLDTDWYSTGGYYYLHQDVPIYLDRHLKHIGADSWFRYVSHIVCEHEQPPLAGFVTTARFGELDVRVALQPPTETLDIDMRSPPQAGVSGVFEPNITPRF